MEVFDRYSENNSFESRYEPGSRAGYFSQDDSFSKLVEVTVLENLSTKNKIKYILDAGKGEFTVSKPRKETGRSWRLHKLDIVLFQ